MTGLSATTKNNSKTDVVVTITIDTTNYNLVGDQTFEIPGAIATSKPTIYVDKVGNEVSTNDKDLNYIDCTEIKQIGYFTNDSGEIQVVRMPKTVQKVPTKLPSQITSLERMFNYCADFNQDISNITNIYNMFNGATSFNQDISNWNIKNVKIYDDFDTNSKLENKNNTFYKIKKEKQMIKHK